MAQHKPYGKAREVSPGVAEVTFSTKRRTAVPQFIRARIEIAGLFDVVGTRVSEPQIVAQGQEGGWLTWRARLLADSEPDTIR